MDGGVRQRAGMTPERLDGHSARVVAGTGLALPGGRHPLTGQVPKAPASKDARRPSPRRPCTCTVPRATERRLARASRNVPRRRRVRHMRVPGWVKVIMAVTFAIPIALLVIEARAFGVRALIFAVVVGA